MYTEKRGLLEIKSALEENGGCTLTSVEFQKDKQTSEVYIIARIGPLALKFGDFPDKIDGYRVHYMPVGAPSLSKFSSPR